MSDAYERLLEARLDSWDRNNTILKILLRALPAGALEARAVQDSPLDRRAVYARSLRSPRVRPRGLPRSRHLSPPPVGAARDPSRIAEMLDESSAAVREAVKGSVEAGRAMDQHYEHPILLLQHMLWHEGYHHRQIKLALKAAGRPLADEDAGPVTRSAFPHDT